MATESEIIEIDRTLLQRLFDIAIQSAGFCSDFVDDDEVAAAREIAELLGVDPMRATPESHRCKYEGAHRWADVWRANGAERTNFDKRCTRCRLMVGPESELL